MPLEILTEKGIEPVYVFKGVELVEGSDSRVIYVESKNQYVIECPSSYSMRSLPLIQFPVSQTFAQWLYSPDRITDRYVQMTTQFKTANNPYEQGVYSGLAVENIKFNNIFSGVSAAISPTTGQNSTVDPTTIYTGRFESTVRRSGEEELTSVMTPYISSEHVNVVVNPDEATDITITVSTTLTAPCIIAIPVSNVLLGNNTVYGEVGNDSTLPSGACLGIISVLAESILYGGELGAYILSDANNTLLKQTQQLLRYTVTTSTSGAPSVPAATDYDFPVAALVTDLIESNRPYYACGVKRAIRTIGTGVFAYGTASQGTKIGVLPWGMAMGSGISKTTLIPNARVSIDTPAFSTMTQRELLGLEDFLSVVAENVNPGNIAELSEKTWIPFCTPEIQLTVTALATAGGCYPVNAGGVLQAPHPVFNGTAKVTPLFVPQYINNCKSHGSTIWNNASMLDRQESLLDLDTPLDVVIRMPSNADFRQKSTVLQTRYSGSYSQSASFDKLDNCARRYFGLSYQLISTPITGSTSTRHAVTIEWLASDAEPTVGKEGAYIPLVSAMSNMLIGVLPAGTPAGTYRYKPFKRYTQVPGSFDPTFLYETISATSHLTSDKNDLPLIGRNLININRSNVNWMTQTAIQEPHLTMVQPIVQGELTNQSTTLQQLEAIVTVAQESVAFMGYQQSSFPEFQAKYVLGADFNDRTRLLISSPFYSEQFQLNVVGMLDWQSHKLYIVSVETDDKLQYIKGFKNLLKAYQYADLPCGTLHRVFGFSCIEDLVYETGENVITALIVGQLDEETSAKYPKRSNIVFLALRAIGDADMVNDTLCYLPVYHPFRGNSLTAETELEDGGQFPLPVDINWPHGIGVQYPYVYLPGFWWYSSPGPSDLRALGNVPENWKFGEGWSMALFRVDLLAGAIAGVIQLSDPTMLATTKAIPADFQTYQGILAKDYDTFKEGIPYATHLTVEQWCSPELPHLGDPGGPTIAGLVGISGLLVAYHNGLSLPVLINPLTGLVETKGSSVYPFSGYYNGNVTSSREFLGIGYVVGNGTAVGFHPFLHVSSGDGSPTGHFTSGIDLQDVSRGLEVIRRVRIRNNLVRDQLDNIRIKVPSDTEKPLSSILSLSMNEDGPWTNNLLLLDRDTIDPATGEGLSKKLDPNKSEYFYLRGAPLLSIPDTELDPIELYLNAEYDRRTVMFGYKLVMPEGL